MVASISAAAAGVGGAAFSYPGGVVADEAEPTNRTSSYPLEPDAAQMRTAIDAVAARIVDHVGSLPEQPSWGNDDPQAIAAALGRARERMPETGEDLESVLEYLFDEAVPVSFNTAGPGYLAYIPGGGVFDASLGAWIADAVNRYVGVFAAAPLLSQIEANVVAWFAEIVGYPPSARGFLTSGGSLANFTGIVTARREMLGEDFLNGVIYASDQMHHCVLKAASSAGFPERAVRMLPADEAFRLRPEDVSAAVAEDRAAGREPFMLVASAGTTNSGAVDPLERLADVAAEEKLWFHVDAAYGGFFALTERGSQSLAGIERSDSLVLDPHKSLFMPYGLGSLIVRDGGALRRAHTIRADYMPPMQDDMERVDFCEISPELSRGFRGLQIWLPLKLHGIDAFRRSLDEKLDLTAWATEELRSEPEIEIVAEPQVTIVAWRWVPEGVDEADLDELNERLLRRINRRRRVYLTATLLRGHFVIRICVLSFRTHADRMEAALEDIRESLGEMRQELAGSAAAAES